MGPTALAAADYSSSSNSLQIEALPPEEDLVVLNLPGGKDALGAAAWIEAALRSGRFVSVQRVPGAAAVVAVPASLLKKADPPPGTSVERSWTALRAKLVDGERPSTVQPLGVLAAIGEALQAAGIPWRAVSSGSEARVLIHRRDLSSAAAALALVGHAVTPATRLCAQLPRLAPNIQEVPGVGTWALVRSEEPVGTPLLEFGDGDPTGPVRIQAQCGVYAEVRLPSGSAKSGLKLAAHASNAGHRTVASHMGRSLVVHRSVVDFQPPIGMCPRDLVTCEDDKMEVVGLPPERRREVWRRLGAASQVVALELMAEDKDRVGFWLFGGQRFVRVTGLLRGRGYIAGTCCKSLAHLMALTGTEVVEAELREHYEAVDGMIEAPGLLRVQRDAWRPERQGSLLYNAGEPAVGGTVSVTLQGTKVSEITLRLPSGLEEQWRVLEWAFDPFGAAGAALAEAASVAAAQKAAEAKASAAAAAAAANREAAAAAAAVMAQQSKKRGYSQRSASSGSSKRGRQESGPKKEAVEPTNGKSKDKKRKNSSSSGSASQGRRRHRKTSRSSSSGSRAAKAKANTVPDFAAKANAELLGASWVRSSLAESSGAEAPGKVSFGFTSKPRSIKDASSVLGEDPDEVPPPLLPLPPPPHGMPPQGVNAPGVAPPPPPPGGPPGAASAATAVAGIPPPPPGAFGGSMEFDPFAPPANPPPPPGPPPPGIMPVPYASSQDAYRRGTGFTQPGAFGMPPPPPGSSSASSVAPPPPPTQLRSGFSGGGDDVSQWVTQNQLDRTAENSLRSLPPDVQRKVMDMGPIIGTNPSAIVMGRIRLARTGTAGPVPQQLGRPPPPPPNASGDLARLPPGAMNDF